MPVDMPPRIARLPRDRHDRPLPYFAGDLDGVRDHRIMDPATLVKAWKNGLCWVCGGPLGGFSTRYAFVIGPMCVVNRSTSEPPSHRDCATYSVQACPFLTVPHMRRRPVEGAHKPAGVMVERNPGAVAIYHTLTFTTLNPGNGILFQLGPAVEVSWWAHGRPATRTEVETAMLDGVENIIRPVAEQFGETSQLNRAIHEARKWLPA